MTINTSTQTNYNTSPSFKARLCARIKVPNAPEMQMYKLGNEDIPFLEKLQKSIDMKELLPEMSEVNNFSHWQKTIDNAITNAIKHPLKEKFLLIFNKKPCAIMTANPDVNATSLDYLASWPVKPNKKPPFAGKTMLRKFFEIAQKNDAQKAVVYPNHHSPVDLCKFYTETGFHKTNVGYLKMDMTKNEAGVNMKKLDSLFTFKNVNGNAITDLSSITLL